MSAVASTTPDLSLAEALGQVVLTSRFLSRLRSDELVELARMGQRRRLAVGRIIEDVASSEAPFRVLLAGRLVLEPSGNQRPDRGLIEVVEAGGVIGEMSLVQDWGLSLRARVVGAADVLEVNPDTIRRFLGRDAKQWTMLAELAAARAIKSSLASSRLLPELHPETRESLVEQGQIVGFAPGQIVLKPEVRSKSLYVILSGELRATISGRNVGTRTVGDVVGEMSLYGDGELCGVSAVTLVRALKISRRAFGELISTHPTVLERLSLLVDERRQEASAHAGADSRSAVAHKRQ